MNIVLLTSIFKPEPIVAAQTSLSIARELTSRGHQVTVITSFPSRPAGKLFPGYKRQLYKTERDPLGFKIVRCFSFPSSKSTLLSRFIENISFGLVAAAYLLLLPNVDIVYSNTWIIFATGLMSLTNRIRHIPYVIRVVDLYPESLISQKRFKPDNIICHLFRRIDQWIAKGATSVVVLTQYFATTYIEDRKIQVNKVAIVPDWVDGDLDRVDNGRANAIRKQFGIEEDSFLAAFGGNIGVAAGVDTMIMASALTPGFHVLIAGDGTELGACQALASQIAPKNVSFFSPWPKEQTMALYQAADVLVLPTRGEQSIASIPSKLIRYMLSGRAIIAASLPGTELENIVKQSHCGWVIPPDDPQALAQTLREAQAMSVEERDRRGMSGREFALSNLTEKVNLPKMVSILERSSNKKEG